MKQDLSEILKLDMVSFIYRDGFAEISPGMFDLLGYSESELKNRSLADTIENYGETAIAKALSDKEFLKSDGSVSGEVVFIDAAGCRVGGVLRVRWRGGSGKSVFGYFFPSGKTGQDGKPLAAEKISDMSISAYVEIDGDFRIITADKGFRFYFNLESDPAGTDMREINGLSELCSALERDKSSCCFSVRRGSDELVAVVNRFPVQTDIRLYGREFLLYSRFPCSLPSVQARRLIWDGVPIAMLMDPASKTIVEANRAASAFYGYSVEELRGMPLSNINILPPEVLSQELEMAVSGVKKFFVFRHRTADGSIKDVNASTTPVELFGKTYIFNFITDITRRKSLERIIEEKNRTLTEINMGLSKMVQREVDNRKKQAQLLMQQTSLTAMGEMVGALAHRWRQPLNTVGLLVQDMEDACSYGELDEKYMSEVVKKIMSTLNSMSASIENFRSLFKTSSEKILFDIKEAVGDVVQLMDAQLKNHRIAVRTDCVFCVDAPDYCVKTSEAGCLAGKLFVLGYRNEFKQMVLNVLTNSFDAIKKRRSDGLIFDGDEGFISVKVEQDGESVSVLIEDNGAGFGEALPSESFEQYSYSARDSLNAVLHVAKTFVESNMGGSVTADDADGVRRVRIKVPLREKPRL